MKKEFSIQKEADRIVTDFSEREVKKAYDRAEREMHRIGCGCPNCVKECVSEVNSWIEWYVGGNPNLAFYQESIMYHIDRNGFIYQGCGEEEE